MIFFYFLARLWVGGIFAFAGFSKLIEPVENFRAALVQYAIFPYSWTLPLAAVVPWFELAFGLFLILGYAPRFSAWALATLALSFLIMLGLSYLKIGHLPTDCGCFGGSGLKLSGRELLMLDFLNFFLAMRLFFVKSHFLSLDAWLHRK